MGPSAPPNLSVRPRLPTSYYLRTHPQLVRQRHNLIPCRLRQWNAVYAALLAHTQLGIARQLHGIEACCRRRATDLAEQSLSRAKELLLGREQIDPQRQQKRAVMPTMLGLRKIDTRQPARH